MTEDSYSRTEETAETVTRGGSGRVAIPVHCMLTSTGVSMAGSSTTRHVRLRLSLVKSCVELSGSLVTDTLGVGTAKKNLCKVAACLAITYFVS